MRQKGSRNNPYGRLGELAGFSGDPQTWAKATEARLAEKYMGDPDMMIMQTRRVAMAAHNGIPGTKEKLAEVRRDYASYWLVRQIHGIALPPVEQQGECWHSAMVARPDRQLALTLAVAGFDTVTPKLNDGDNVLLGFTFSAGRAELEEFLQYVPQHDRMRQINERGSDGMTAMHVAAATSGEGCLGVLQREGGYSAALMDIVLPGNEAIKGNVAHIAVMNGRCESVAELMALDRGLFTRYDPAMKYTPDEMVLHVSQTGADVNREIRKAANIAAYAIDRELPFPEVGWVINRLTPATAPKAVIRSHSLN